MTRSIAHPPYSGLLRRLDGLFVPTMLAPVTAVARTSTRLCTQLGGLPSAVVSAAANAEIATDPTGLVFRGSNTASDNWWNVATPTGFRLGALGITAVVRMRKRDTTIRASTAFANNFALTRCSVHLPEAGGVSWDVDGPSGYARTQYNWEGNAARFPLTQWHTWVFTANHTRDETAIWCDGQEVASRVAAGLGATYSVNESNFMFCGAPVYGSDGRGYGGSDDSDYQYFGFWQRALRVDEIQMISRYPDLLKTMGSRLATLSLSGRILRPTSDIANTGWTPTPAFSRLQTVNGETVTGTGVGNALSVGLG